MVCRALYLVYKVMADKCGKCKRNDICNKEELSSFLSSGSKINLQWKVNLMCNYNKIVFPKIFAI